MSSALVRQALEFVDQDGTDKRKRNKRRTPSSRNPSALVQGFCHPYQGKSKKSNKKVDEDKSSTEEKIKKLLALSTSDSDGIIKQKIVERAIKGKPLLEKIEIEKEDKTSILFPEETFKEFEKEYFCN